MTTPLGHADWRGCSHARECWQIHCAGRIPCGSAPVQFRPIERLIRSAWYSVKGQSVQRLSNLAELIEMEVRLMAQAGSLEAIEQARRMGIPERLVHLFSGAVMQRLRRSASHGMSAPRGRARSLCTARLWRLPVYKQTGAQRSRGRLDKCASKC